MPGAEFARTYWNRRWLHARRGLDEIRSALGGAWGMKQWRTAIELGWRWPGSPHTLQASGVPGKYAERLRLQPEQIDEALANGATIIGDVLDERLTRFGAALKDELNVPGPMSTYASLSPGGDAAVPHYDGSHVFVLQLEGSKQWRLSPGPVVTNPSRGRRVSADGQLDTPHRGEDETFDPVDLNGLDTVQLEAGDFLYVPAGTIHATATAGHSLSIMFNFAPPRFDALVELLVRRTLGAMPAWRGLPPGAQGANSDYLNEGLERVRETLADLHAESPEVQAAWDEMTANLGALQNSFAARQHPGATALDAAARLRVNPLYPVRYGERMDADGELRVTVYLGEDLITDTGAGAEFLREVVARGSFTAEEACYWSGEPYDWDVVRSYLASLVEQRLLVCAGE